MLIFAFLGSSYLIKVKHSSCATSDLIITPLLVDSIITACCFIRQACFPNNLICPTLLSDPLMLEKTVFPLLNFQITEALLYLHYSCKTIHQNICPQSVIINKKGTWKLSGFEFTIKCNENDIMVRI